MDKIKIKKLEVYAKHGVYPEENVLGQKFVISAVLYTSTRKAGLTDDLEESVNYGEVSHFIRRFVEEHTWKLLEKVLEQLAQAILLQYPLLRRVDLEIEKPWAPVGLPLETVSVEISRGWHTVYIALGSNMGNKEQYLNDAVKLLNEREDSNVLKVSEFIVTKPYGGVEQDDFLNGALELHTLLEPQELLDVLHDIEQRADRKRLVHWGPRTLDLDILFYDDLIFDSPALTIPHIEIEKRDFVLTPLYQIAPWLRHPATKKTVKQMLQELLGS
jgi:dihydroneopterin aldolase/2-amino-4-hydroxy-6-hydroxymethyldihydropteridine diphosphokinase